ncbi:hypothetical protein GGQ99_000392 [Aminobacter niigataensis]|uniref:Uncharacterized protein n=1 Tax=Aminobacter niigataensis TaxID=83265 RepID=A0ABR6KW42_9HYPH|nr:hypothetical protein [Aminobacter niigataensis]MBB4648670.1 hypothetical protein [Aminobacter niigataensis]
MSASLQPSSRLRVFKFRRRSASEVAAEAASPSFGLRLPRSNGIVKNLVRFGLLSSGEPPLTRFSRTEIATHVNLYSAGRSAPNLIVGFATKHGFIMMGAALFLEDLDDAQHDFLQLADPRREFFDGGIEGFASSMRDLALRVGNLARERGYRSIMTYGTSMGGFPAIRAGNLMGADRAISVGGRYAWHPGSMAKGLRVGAFDTLCNCRSPLTTRCYLLYSVGCREDLDHAAKLAAIAPASHRIGVPGRKHNFPMVLKDKGKLGGFHAEIFNLAREPDPSRIAALMG